MTTSTLEKIYSCKSPINNYDPGGGIAIFLSLSIF